MSVFIKINVKTIKKNTPTFILNYTLCNFLQLENICPLIQVKLTIKNNDLL